MEIKYEDSLAIINAGILAPSADNSQPWKFKINPDAIEVSFDPTRVGMFFDSALSATYMSLGAVCENMQLQALKLGIHAQVELHNSQAVSSNPAFTLHLSKTSTSYDSLADAIPDRMTNRFLYRRNDILDKSTLSNIAQCIGPELGCHVDWASAPKAKTQIFKAVMLADLVRFTQPQIHQDFHAKLRFGRAAQEAEDGLTADTLGIEKPLLPALKLLRPWPIARALNLIGLHYFMAWRGAWLPMWAASGIGVIHAEPEVGYFDMGRALERVWLAANQSGLAFQPLGALTLLSFRLRILDGIGFNDRQKERLEQADASWRTSIGVADSNQLVMIFRVGRVDENAPRSKRRQGNQFLMA